MPSDEETLSLCERVCKAEEPEQFKAALGELKAAVDDSLGAAENYAMMVLLDNIRPLTRKKREAALKHIREQAALKRAA